MPADVVITALAATIPPWLRFPAVRERVILGFAGPANTIWSNTALDVTITSSAGTGWIKETQPDRLPSWCPEVHLNGDRTFCLGLQPIKVTDTLSARQWWADVKVHLDLLSVALKTGVWPLHSGLDHGVAGHHLHSARRLAEKLGLEEEYARAQLGDPSWITDASYSIVTLEGARLSADRDCPCGCRDAKGRPFALRLCPRRKQVNQLIILERARRLELQAFWTSAREAGAKCCGVMRDCPLREGKTDSPPAEALAKTRRLVHRTIHS